MEAISDAIWRKVLKRDDYKCIHCNAEEDLQPAHYEARSLAGEDSVNNLMTLCALCHRRLHDGSLLVKKIKDHFFFKEIRFGRKNYKQHKNGN